VLQAAYAEAQAETGHLEMALETLDDAFTRTERTGQRWIESDLYRIRGDILTHAARPDLAEVALQRAMEIARDQHARTFELRAGLALARVYQATKRDASARALLTSVLEGFSPTQDLSEIEQARLLLAAQ
jgi:predicted ATPase